VPLRAALPVLRTVRFTERRLQADLLTVSATVMLLVGYIIWDRGVEELLDNLLGEGPKGSIACIVLSSRVSQVFTFPGCGYRVKRRARSGLHSTEGGTTQP
jgi:hypothetical protein